MLTQTSGLPSCQVCVVVPVSQSVSHTRKSVLYCDSLSYFNTFQSCTATLKAQSLPSTGSALRWSSENMVCIKVWMKSTAVGVKKKKSFCTILNDFFILF